VAIKEIGTGVYPMVPNILRGTQRIYVGRANVNGQVVGRLRPPYEDNNTPRWSVWLASPGLSAPNGASALGFDLHPILQTSPGDPSNPGLVYGQDWEVWGALSYNDTQTNPFSGGVPGPAVAPNFIAAQAALTVTDYELVGAYGHFRLEPGREKILGSVGQATWLGLKLFVRTGALGGDPDDLDALRALVAVTGYSSASS
jgi:hypothetical protein